MTATPFRFVLSADFYDEAGELKYDDIGLSTFDDHPEISTTTMAEFRQVVMPDQLQNCHGSLLLTPHVTADSVRDCDDLLVIARFGVGYDSVDVPACTEQSVLVTIAVGAVDRPVAEATVGWMIALTHHMLVKDRLVRTGDWDKRSQYMGCELRDRTLGMVGLGRIGRSVVKLLEGFGMNQPIGFDPFLSQDAFDEIGVRSVGLQELLQTADFVSLHCPLSDETRDLIGMTELSWMKPGAYLINVARGGIVNEDALYQALKKGQIAGAALDCFDSEPVTEPHRFGEFDNVLLAPHSIAWTNELFRDIGRTACQGVLDLAHGKTPNGIVNPEVLDQPRFQEKWDRLLGR